MISYTSIQKPSIRLLASQFLVGQFLVGVACILLALPNASAKDLESPLGLWLTGGPNDCVPDQIPADPKTGLPSSCSAVQGPPLDAAQLNAAARAATLARLQADESNFFTAFSYDQIQESKCEMKLLSALDQLPSVPDAPTNITWGSSESIARALTLATADHSEIQTSETAYKNQKVILDNIWKMLPLLEPLKRQVEITEKALPVGFLEGLSILTPPGMAESSALYKKAKARVEAYLAAEASYHSVLSQVMDNSGSDPAIENYTEKVLSENEKGLTKDQFMKYALQAVDPDRPELSFQQKVVEPMRYSTNQRLCDYETFSTHFYERSMWNDGNKIGICGNYVSTPPWSVDPNEQSNTERSRKRILMESDAALEFMQKSPDYQKDYSEFSCLLVSKYRKGPKVIHTGENVALFVGTIGIGLWASGFRAAYAAGTARELPAIWETLLYNSGTITTALGKGAGLALLLTNECAHDGGNIPKSVLAAPVCEKIDPKHPDDPAFTQVLEQSVQQKDCLTAVYLSAMGLKMLMIAPTQVAPISQSSKTKASAH